jgi:hypothetical protein
MHAATDFVAMDADPGVTGVSGPPPNAARFRLETQIAVQVGIKIAARFDAPIESLMSPVSVH